MFRFSLSRCFCIVFSCLSFIQGTWGLTLVDSRPFCFVKSKVKGIRVMIIETDPLVLKEVHYFPQAFLKKSQAVGQNPFVIDKRGQVTLAPKQNFILSRYPENQTYALLRKDKKDTPLQTLDRFEKGFKNRAIKGKPVQVLKIFWYGPHKVLGRTLNTLSSSLHDNTQERGALGELVTDAFLTSYGFHKHVHPNKSNHGLDGLFQHTQDKTLFVLSESKCRNESKAALRYLEDDLSEWKIVKKLGKIPSTAFKDQFLKAFLKEGSLKVLKLAQRLLVSGHVESACETMDHFLFIYHLYPHLSQAPFAVQQKASTLFIQKLKGPYAS